MAPDEHEKEQRQPNQEAQVTAELAGLTARVDSLERLLAELRAEKFGALRAAPPPPPFATAPRTEKMPAPNASAPAPRAKGSLEDRIGSQLFSLIGIVALVVATALLLKWAIDNHWIGQLGRVLIGLIVGAAIVVWSERFRRKGFGAFSYALKAVGSGVLYLSLWAAFQLYHLLPAGVALGAMVLVTAWNAYMAWSQNSQILAGYALVGAFATPLLLSTGGNHEIFLFLYLLAIDIATVMLVRLKPWPILLVGAFPATVAFFIGWYVEYFGAFNVGQPVTITTIFIVLFFLIFVLPAIHRIREDGKEVSITEIFLPLGNAMFVALALYSVLVDSHHKDLLPWIAVLLGAFYLVLMRLPQTRVTSAVHLSLAVVFLTIAIPLKASGHWITIGWLAEGVALLWVSARLSRPTPELAGVGAHRIVRRLAILALALGFCGLLIEPFWLYYGIDTAFLNRRFATSLFGVAVLGASAAIALRARQHDHADSPSWRRIAGASIIALNIAAILACIRELDTAWRYTPANTQADIEKSLAVSAFLMLYGAGLLAIGFWKRSAFIRWQALILIVFTIGKTFIFDARSLTQGYHGLSFLGLGALLMAISFAYQKDWLALRQRSSATTGDGNKTSSDGVPGEGANR